MKSSSKKRVNTDKLIKTNDSTNSFLVETTFNSDIDIEVRKEIDKKYLKSKTNSEYKFPRKPIHRKAKSKHVYSKSSFEPFIIGSHKPSKSSLITSSDGKNMGKYIESNTEKSHSKKVSFNFKFLDLRVLKKKEKRRNHSCRSVKTDRLTKSKSPKQFKKPSESKNLTSTSKKNIEIMNKIFTPYSSKNKLMKSSATMRIKRIYHSIKGTNNVN